MRFPPNLLELVEAEVERTNANRKGVPYELGQWIRQACIEKLRHSARSRGIKDPELAELDSFPTTGL